MVLLWRNTWQGLVAPVGTLAAASARRDPTPTPHLVPAQSGNSGLTTSIYGALRVDLALLCSNKETRKSPSLRTTDSNTVLQESEDPKPTPAAQIQAAPALLLGQLSRPIKASSPEAG